MSRINQECEKYVPNGQHGRLFIETKKSIMEGSTTNVWVLPKDITVDVSGAFKTRIDLKKHGVQVYGHIEGRTFGWIIQGKWINDVNKLIENSKFNYDEEVPMSKEEKEAQKQLKDEKLQEKLDNYTNNI